MKRTPSFPFEAALPLLAALLLAAGTGCDDGNPTGEYPPPGEGSDSAHVTLLHELREPAGDDFVWAELTLFTEGQQVVDAEVSVGGQLLAYHNNLASFAGQLTPAPQPGSSQRVYVRSVSWGEDSTYVRVPGSFEILDPVPVAAEPGRYTLAWESAAHASSYRVSVRDAVQDTLVTGATTSDTSLAVDLAGVATVHLRVRADRLHSDTQIWRGRATAERSRSVSLE
jgi:hypothetical protein